MPRHFSSSTKFIAQKFFPIAKAMVLIIRNIYDLHLIAHCSETEPLKRCKDNKIATQTKCIVRFQNEWAGCKKERQHDH